MIEIQNLVFSYAGERLIDDLSLSVEKGFFIGITGENGSGKTTFLRLLAGLEKPEKGTLAIAKGYLLAYVRQTTPGEEGNFPATVAEIVSLGAVTNHTLFIPRQTKKKVREALEKVALVGKEKAIFSTLSGGQKQRVKLAKALVKDPDILLLDEPMTGLDEAARGDFLGILEGLKKEQKTILMVSHRPDDFRDADKIFILENGRLTEETKHV